MYIKFCATQEHIPKLLKPLVKNLVLWFNVVIIRRKGDMVVIINKTFMVFAGVAVGWMYNRTHQCS